MPNMSGNESSEAPFKVLEEHLLALERDRMRNRVELRRLTTDLRARAEDVSDTRAAELYLRALNVLSVDELTHPDVTAITRRLKLRTIPHADSFWHSILTRRRKKQIGNVPEKYLGLNKVADKAFARRVGVRTSETWYQGDFGGVPRNRVPAVLKPVASSDSLGAFYIFETGVFSIASSRPVAGWTPLEQIAREELGLEDLNKAIWQLQRLETLGGLPAPDIKFYCFYGEIGAVLEVSRHPEKAYAYFDHNLDLVTFRNIQNAGFTNPSETSVFRGLLDEAKLQIARDFSKRLPVPFMRIDFFNTDHGLVFCEFSSAPGWSHDLTDEHDERLGTMYHAAEIRLMNDLLAGKGFDDYREFASTVGPHA